jgi:cytochrome P450
MVEDHANDPWSRLPSQADEPVFYMPNRDVYCVTTDELVRQVFSAPDVFSSAPLGRKVTPLARKVFGGGPVNSLVQMDGPEHRRIRKLGQREFTNSIINARGDEVRALANRLIDGFIGAGQTDLQATYTGPIPVIMMTSMLGAPPDKAERVDAWNYALLRLADLGSEALSEEELATLTDDLDDFASYIGELIDERRETPRDDALSRLATAEPRDGESPLTRDEIIGLIAAVLTAGTHSTKTMMTITFHRLLEHRERWEAVVARPELSGHAFEEAIRHRFVGQGLSRYATRDAELAGVKIPKGARIYLYMPAALRDPARYESADEFDLERTDLKDHLGWGFRTHFCLGAALARLEGRIAIETLAQRIPGLSLADDAPLRLAPGDMVALTATPLNVRWTTA